MHAPCVAYRRPGVVRLGTARAPLSGAQMAGHPAVQRTTIMRALLLRRRLQMLHGLKHTAAYLQQRLQLSQLHGARDGARNAGLPHQCSMSILHYVVLTCDQQHCKKRPLRLLTSRDQLLHIDRCEMCTSTCILRSCQACTNAPCALLATLSG
jgi:hypothetical protein